MGRYDGLCGIRTFPALPAIATKTLDSRSGATFVLSFFVNQESFRQMAVKIRMQRGGATHHPHYRVVVTDIRSPRDGRFVEKVGIYDPKNKHEDEQVKLDLERIDYWIGVGAKPSDTVRSLIKRARRKAAKEEATVAEAPAEEATEAATE